MWFLRRGRYKRRGRYSWALFARLAHNFEPYQSYFILSTLVQNYGNKLVFVPLL